MSHLNNLHHFLKSKGLKNPSSDVSVWTNKYAHYDFVETLSGDDQILFSRLYSNAKEEYNGRKPMYDIPGYYDRKNKEFLVASEPVKPTVNDTVKPSNTKPVDPPKVEPPKNEKPITNEIANSKPSKQTTKPVAEKPEAPSTNVNNTTGTKPPATTPSAPAAPSTPTVSGTGDASAAAGSTKSDVGTTVTASETIPAPPKSNKPVVPVVVNPNMPTRSKRETPRKGTKRKFEEDVLDSLEENSLHHQLQPDEIQRVIDTLIAHGEQEYLRPENTTDSPWDTALDMWNGKKSFEVKDDTGHKHEVYFPKDYGMILQHLKSRARKLELDYSKMYGRGSTGLEAKLSALNYWKRAYETFRDNEHYIKNLLSRQSQDLVPLERPSLHQEVATAGITESVIAQPPLAGEIHEAIDVDPVFEMDASLASSGNPSDQTSAPYFIGKNEPQILDDGNTIIFSGSRLHYTWAVHFNSIDNPLGASYDTGTMNYGDFKFKPLGFELPWDYIPFYCTPNEWETCLDWTKKIWIDHVEVEVTPMHKSVYFTTGATSSSPVTNEYGPYLYKSVGFNKKYQHLYTKS